MVLSLSLVLIGCSRAPACALDMINRDVDWKRLDTVQLQFEQTYVDIEDVKGLREMLDNVILDDEPEPASKGWTFALEFDKRNQSVLTLTKFSEKRFHIVYRDLEYKVKESGIIRLSAANLPTAGNRNSTLVKSESPL